MTLTSGQAQFALQVLPPDDFPTLGVESLLIYREVRSRRDFPELAQQLAALGEQSGKLVIEAKDVSSTLPGRRIDIPGPS